MNKCSKKLFGYNLEFTRRLGYGGLYAEMIYNGKIQNNAAGFYPVEYKGMSGLGQSTDRIHFMFGKEYKWHIVAGEKVVIRFLSEFQREIHRSTEHTGSFICKFNLPYSRVEVVSDSEIKYISVKPADALYECRRDVLDMMKLLKPQTIRFPGGCFAEKYVWKDGLLPIEDRPVVPSHGKKNLFSANEGYDGHELNIDDYVGICRYVGAEPEYTIRLTQNDPMDAAHIVEYCNGDISTPYGALRASRGHKEPYNIKTWYIGNEVGFITDAEHAAELSDSFVKEMLKVDPTIRTVVTTGIIEKWDDIFLEKAQHVDICAQHSYILDNDVRPGDMSDALVAADKILLPILTRAHQRAHGKKMLLDEWNYQWGTLGSSVTALYAASVMTMLIRNAESLDIDGASYFAPVNEGAIRVYSDHVQMAPDGEVLMRMTGHIGGTIVTNDDSTFVKTIHDGYSYISVYNNSAQQERTLSSVSGEYEILSPNGNYINITKGFGDLTCLPPASVAFVKTKL